MKQGEKIKVNIEKEGKTEKPANSFNFKDDAFWNFPSNPSQPPTTVQSAIVTGSTANTSDPFEFFSSIEVGKKKVAKQNENLLDL